MQHQAQDAQIYHWPQVPHTVPLKKRQNLKGRRSWAASRSNSAACVPCTGITTTTGWSSINSSLGAEPWVTFQGLRFTLPGTHHCWGTPGAELGSTYHTAPSKCQHGSGLAQVIPQDNYVLSCLLLPGPTPGVCTTHKSQCHASPALLQLPCTNFIFSSLCFLTTFSPSFHVSSSVISTDGQSCYPPMPTF